MGTHLIFHRVDDGIGQQNTGLQVEHPHGAVYGIDGQRGIIRIGIVEVFFLAGEQVVEQIPPRHFGGGGIRLRDRRTGRIVPDGLVVLAEHGALLRADQIHQLISAIVVQVDRACTGVLLVTGQLLAGGGVVQAVGIGIHKTLDPAKLNETYNYYSPLLSTEDGIYFYGCYNGPGSSWLYDVLDSDGDVVVSGLRTCENKGKGHR